MKDHGFNSKFLEVKMPSNGKELKIKHGLNPEEIINVSVLILNHTGSNVIMRSQVDLISGKALFNWYLDKENLVIFRPNNVKYF